MMVNKLSDNTCEFCNEFKHGIVYCENDILYKQLYNKFGKSRIIYETSHWAILPTIGCFVEGYVLAVNKSHYLSLHQCDVESKNEFINLVELFRCVYRDIYKSDMVFFEHGTIMREHSSCSVEHVHLHFIPIQDSIWHQFLLLYNPKYYKIIDINQLSDIVESNHLVSYLLFCDIDGATYVIEPDKKKYPSQFFRMFILECIGKSNKCDSWNWKKDFYIENMYSTYKNLSDYFLKQ